MGLYARLTGAFMDGRSARGVNSRDHRLLSILGNLTSLLNARHGSRPHLPSYGLPDLSSVYRDMPGSINQLESEILKAVDAYEPRLSDVRLRRVAGHDQFGLDFEISGTIDGVGPVAFATRFHSTKPVRVKMRTDASN